VAWGGCYERFSRELEDERYWEHSHRITQAISEEQFSALLARLKVDAGLQEKLKGAVDLDPAVALAKEAGFDISRADWLKFQAKQNLWTLELSDVELEGVAGGCGCMTAAFDSFRDTDWCE